MRTFACLLLFMAALVLGSFALPDKAEAKTFFIGDSRLCWLYNTLYSGYQDELCKVQRNGEEIWMSRVSMGYVWMESVAVPFIDLMLEPGDDVVCCLGVNDPFNAELYADALNMHAAEWKRKDVNVFFVSVNPIDTEKAIQHGFMYHFNGDTVNFNNTVLMGLNPELVTYIDTRAEIADDWNTIDGLHYDEDTSLEIYDYVNKVVWQKRLAQKTEKAVAAASRPDVASAAAPAVAMVILLGAVLLTAAQLSRKDP